MRQTRSRAPLLPPPRTRAGRWLRAFAVWLVPGFGFLFMAALAFSPAAIDRLTRLVEGAVQVPARVSDCQPWRDGIHRSSVIRCRIDFTHDGQAYSLQRTAWQSQSPWLSAEGLGRALAAQSAVTTRIADVPADRPELARLPDTRWLAMPAPWVWALGLFAGLVALAVRLDPSTLPWRRAELVADPATGHLMPIDGSHHRRVRRRIAAQGVIAAMLVGLCIVGLSNTPAALLGQAAMGALQPVPARLVDCEHQRRGGYRGHDQIECGFTYTVAGQTLRGQAESLDFRYFPTRARLDAEVARLQADPTAQTVTAHVHPRHPGYARAFIRDDAFVKYTWGLFELELGILIAALTAYLAWTLGRWHRAGKADAVP